MSDYFGALMRSSGLKVGPRQSASRESGEPTNLSRTGPFRTHADADDIVEIDETREAGETGLETTARHAQSHESTAVDRPRFANREPAPGRPLSDTPREEVRAGREPVDVERLQRAVIDAALRWVTSDPQARHPEPAGAESPSRPTADDSLPGMERPHGTRTDADEPSQTSSRAIFTRTGDDLSMAEIDFEAPSRPSSDRALLSSQERNESSRPAEDVVEVSIGSIHVHVDGPKAKPAAQAAPRRNREGREPSSGSGLHRRYLRAI